MKKRIPITAGPALWLVPILVGIVWASHSSHSQETTPNSQAPNDATSKAPEKIEIRGIENTFRLSPRLYSGGDPHGIGQLTALKNLGIKTIISVDGSIPDVENARKLGLRYVHLPIGYDGVPREQAVRLVQAVKSLPGPVYVHCHHGKHRGPAAAAICALATELWTKNQARAWMELAGASPDYRGLYASARDFVPPTGKELERVGNDLPERSKAAALVETMVKVDERWDHLKAAQKSGFNSHPDQPDIDPTHESLQLLELFREAAKILECRDKGEDFSRQLASAEHLAANLHQAMTEHSKKLSASSLKQLESAFVAAGKSCTACHARHRDN